MKKWVIIIGRIIGPGIVGLNDLSTYERKQANTSKLVNDMINDKTIVVNNSKTVKIKQKGNMSRFAMLKKHCIKFFNNIFNPLKGIPDLDFNGQYDSDML